MQENNTSLQETADYIGVQCRKFMETYLSARARLSPSLGPDAARFIEVLSFWMVGNITFVQFWFSCRYPTPNSHSILDGALRLPVTSVHNDCKSKNQEFFIFNQKCLSTTNPSLQMKSDRSCVPGHRISSLIPHAIVAMERANCT